jgi:lipoic acid synthetase
MQRLLRRGQLHTVCETARCPNRHECFGRGTATFLILGNICTRHCAFCAVRRGTPLPPAADEPQRVAAAAVELRLSHVVVTSVTRDDLGDGGASIFAATIGTLKKRLPDATVEVLTPDFTGAEEAVAVVLRAGPHVFNHNLETVRRMQPVVRPQADYDRSLRVLRIASQWNPAVIVKSGLMVGLGETDEELGRAMDDLRAAGCSVLTIGQYLAPSPRHAPVARFVSPRRFQEYARRALTCGFSAVASGPLVRSSYQAEALWHDRRDLADPIKRGQSALEFPERRAVDWRPLEACGGGGGADDHAKSPHLESRQQRASHSRPSHRRGAAGDGAVGANALH